MTMQFSAEEEFAKQLDAEDPLRSFRDKFHLPLGKGGKPLIYFAGNSLGLMPKLAREVLDQELDDWAKLGVDAHLGAKTPWYTYHEPLRKPMARIVGAKPVEVICMNSLTANLHMMMATFYRPTKSRKNKILMEDPAFPSDTYAIKTQIRHHGLDPKDALVLASPRKGEFTVRTEDVVDLIENELSRRQGARAWELRTATDLAALWISQGRSGDAQALLGPIFGQFTEGFDTEDLKAAERLLARLG